jgi:4-alpha-glucanotransferase
MALKQEFGGRAWFQWPAELRDRDPAALEHWGRKLQATVLYEKFCQFLFFQQWGRLRDYLRQRGIKVIGDAPIYVTHDSADCWSHQHLFKLDEAKQPVYVAGVPPDYFSETGQRWGNPVYDWKALEAENFGWWLDRLRHNFGLYDLVRLDHFRGFAAYWEIPADEPTAVNGAWIFAAGFVMLDALREQIGEIPIIAEDLGVITPDVVQLKDEFNLPGMKVLQFAFTENEPAGNRDIPFHHTRNCVAYTGTHDNNTTRGWFRTEASAGDKKTLARYQGKKPTQASICWDMIRLCYASVADAAVVPAQDFLQLDETARMNTPSTTEGNWLWRLSPGQLTDKLAREIKAMVELFGRTGRTAIQYDTYEASEEPEEEAEEAPEVSQGKPAP